MRPKVVVIGVSTGGPTALGAILPQLPAGFPLPVLVVQHMPPLFTRLLAERLHSTCRLPVEEASQGEPVDAGKDPDCARDFHLKVARNGGGVHVLSGSVAAAELLPSRGRCAICLDRRRSMAAQSSP